MITLNIFTNCCNGFASDDISTITDTYKSWCTIFDENNIQDLNIFIDP